MRDTADAFDTYVTHMTSTVGGPADDEWVYAVRRIHAHAPIESWPAATRDLFNCCRFISYPERYKLYSFLYGNSPGEHATKAQDTASLMRHMLRDDDARRDVRVNLPKAMLSKPEQHEYYDVHHGLICSMGGGSVRYTDETMYNKYLAMEWERYCYALVNGRARPPRPPECVLDWVRKQQNEVTKLRQ